MNEEQVKEFLKESNAIEGVYDEQSLTDALEAWNYLMEQDTMNPQFVKRAHKILMQNQNLEHKYKGKYRDCPVWVGGKGTIPSNELYPAVRNWCTDINRKHPHDSVLSRETKAKCDHITYEKVHPFVDGNGRTGRMFMNWQRIKKLDLPLLTIHEGEEQQKYYGWFK